MLDYKLDALEASEALIKDLYIDLRTKVNEWPEITNQTTQAHKGYIGQHLVSVVMGYPGGKSDARGYDLIMNDGTFGEIKTCYQVDQLGSCNKYGAVVSSLEIQCATCGSQSKPKNTETANLPKSNMTNGVIHIPNSIQHRFGRKFLHRNTAAQWSKRSKINSKICN